MCNLNFEFTERERTSVTNAFNHCTIEVKASAGSVNILFNNDAKPVLERESSRRLYNYITWLIRSFDHEGFDQCVLAGFSGSLYYREYNFNAQAEFCKEAVNEYYNGINISCHALKNAPKTVFLAVIREFLNRLCHVSLISEQQAEELIAQSVQHINAKYGFEIDSLVQISSRKVTNFFRTNRLSRQDIVSVFGEENGENVHWNLISELAGNLSRACIDNDNNKQENHL